MSEDVYAVPDLTKKVRHGRRGQREVEMEERGEREERIVDIYVSADDPDPGTQQHAVQRNKAQEQLGDSDETKKNRSRVAAVCLVLLCVLLLGSIIGLVIYYFELIKEKKNNLAKERDEIQFNFDLLESRYNNLTDEQDQLQSRFDQLETRYDRVTEERDDLKRIICESHGFQFGGGVCYYISTEEKNWWQSRQDCRDKQSHLMIIKNKDKQDLVQRLNKRVWLGLSDSASEGIWKWVDGTPLTTPTYWYDPQPNENGDCLEFLNGGESNRGWNDRGCFFINRWICERDIY